MSETVSGQGTKGTKTGYIGYNRSCSAFPNSWGDKGDILAAAGMSRFGQDGIPYQRQKNAFWGFYCDPGGGRGAKKSGTFQPDNGRGALACGPKKTHFWTFWSPKKGELMRAVPKATPNNNPFHENNTAVNLVKPKTAVVADADQCGRYGYSNSKPS